MAPREDESQIVTRKPPEWSPKAFKIEAQTFQNRAQMAPGGGQDGSKIEKKHKANKKREDFNYGAPF